MSPARPTAVVITTFDVEALAVAEHLDEPAQLRHHREARGTVYELGTFTGDNGAWTVVVAEIGAGNSTAGVELERATAVFAPHAILLVGVAGGLKDVRLGDVVAADVIYDYESAKDTDDGVLPRIKTHSSSHRLLQHARLVARHRRWPSLVRPFSAESGIPLEPPRAMVKPIAAGGKLVAGDRSGTANLLRQSCGDAVAVEMEGHGFLHGAYRNQATSALVVRGISDLLSDKDPAHDAFWQPTAARHAAGFAFAVLDSLRSVSTAEETAGERVMVVTAITDPLPSQQVGHTHLVTGNAAALPANRNYWLVVQPAETPRYHPQPGPISLAPDGTWTAMAYFGRSPSRDIGERFLLMLVEAGEQANEDFLSYLAQAALHNTYGGLAFLRDVKRLSQMVVVRK